MYYEQNIYQSWLQSTSSLATTLGAQQSGRLREKSRKEARTDLINVIT